MESFFAAGTRAASRLGSMLLLAKACATKIPLALVMTLSVPQEMPLDIQVGV